MVSGGRYSYSDFRSGSSRLLSRVPSSHFRPRAHGFRRSFTRSLAAASFAPGDGCVRSNNSRGVTERSWNGKRGTASRALRLTDVRGFAHHVSNLDPRTEALTNSHFGGSAAANRRQQP
jgi:hypothetical protein